MARYPRYQSKASLGGLTNIDFANQREIIRQQEVIKQNADKLTNYSMNIYKQTRVSEGIKKGIEDSEGTLQDLSGRTPITAFDKARYQSASKISQARIESEASLEMSKLIAQADRDNMAPEDFNLEMQSIVDGYSSSLQNFMPEDMANTQIKLEDLKNTYFIKYNNDFITEAQDRLKRDGLLHFDQISQNFEIKNGSLLDDELFDQNLDTHLTDYKLLLESLEITGSDAQSKILKERNKQREARVTNLFNDSTNKAEFKKQFDGSKGSGLSAGMDTKTRLRISKYMRNEINRKDSSNTVLVKSIKNGMTIITDSLKRGASITENIVELEEKINFLPDDDDNKIPLKQELEVLQSIAPTIEEFRKLPQLEQNLVRQEIKKEVNADNKVTQLENTLLDLLEKTQSKVNKENPGLAKNINDLKDVIFAGNRPNKGQLERIRKAVEGGDNADLKEQLEFLEKAYQVFDDLASKPGSDAKKEIMALAKELNITTGHTKATQTLIKNLDAVLKTKTDEMVTDPAGYQESTDPQFPALDVNNLISNQPTENLQNRFDYIDNISEYEKVPPKYLTETEASQIKSSLDTANGYIEKIRIITNLNEKFGDRSDEMFEQLYDDKSPDGLEYATLGYIASRGSPLVMDVVKGLDLEQKKDVDESVKLASGVNNELGLYVNETLSRAGLPENMILLYKKFVRGAYITDNFKNGFDDTLDQEKVDVMLEKLVGPMLNWDPDGMDRDTEKVLLPFGENPDEVDEFLENMNLQEFLVGTKQNKPGYIVDDEFVEFDNFEEDLKAKFYLQPLDSEGNYRISQYSPYEDDPGFIYTQTPTGGYQPLVFNLLDSLEAYRNR